MAGQFGGVPSWTSVTRSSILSKACGSPRGMVEELLTEQQRCVPAYLRVLVRVYVRVWVDRGYNRACGQCALVVSFVDACSGSTCTAGSLLTPLFGLASV
eukprot:m.227580 g.227580  ORF g.227580 m.227580 type:complete len:100 (+) comp18817_c2_seq2:937-1236(+)